MKEDDTAEDGRRLRSDARRNRERLIAAATELILLTGGGPSRDAVAQHAGVGIATLYRHFPDQQNLLRAVVLDVLDRTIAAGESALADTDRQRSLGRYLHSAIDSGLGVVNIIHPLLNDTDWPDRSATADRVLEQLVIDARRAGVIGHDITPPDIALAAIRFSRPLAIGIDTPTEREIAHRQLDHYLAGLTSSATRP